MFGYIYIHSYYDYTILFVEGFSNHLGYPQDMFCFSGFILGGTGISKSLVNGYCKTSWKPKKYFGIQVEPYGTTCDLWHCGERSRLWATIRWSVLVKRAERWERALIFFRSVWIATLSPTLVTYSATISALEKCGSLVLSMKGEFTLKRKVVIQWTYIYII